MGDGNAVSTQAGRCVEDSADPDLCEHTVWFGDGIDDLYELATRALGTGARRGEKLLFGAEQRDADRLRARGEMDRLLASGQLQVLATDTVYSAHAALDPADLISMFERLLDDAISSGYRGLRVVADNTAWAADGEEAFSRWLTWEHMADRFQASSGATGICYFDRTRLAGERQMALASLHTARGASTPPPPFTLTAGPEGTSILAGELDLYSADAFARVVVAAPSEAPLVVDLSGVEFIDHRALLVLARAASPSRPVRLLHAAPMHRKLVELLGAGAAGLSVER